MPWGHGPVDVVAGGSTLACAHPTPGRQHGPPGDGPVDAVMGGSTCTVVIDRKACRICCGGMLGGLHVQLVDAIV